MIDRIDNTLQNLRANGFDAVYYETAEDAKNFILSKISPEMSVAFGGSITLEQMGLYESLKDRGNEVHWHWRPEEGMTREEILKKDMFTDIYCSGANGITEDGRIINIDGTGNRLSSLLFGHKHLFIVAGVNKISKNYEESIIRIKNVARPLNTQRLKLDTPCAKNGKCMNCKSDDRICNATLIMERQHGGIPTTIVLIDQKLGF